MWKQHGFFEQRNYIGKSTWKRCGFFNQQNYIEKVLVNDMEFRGNLHNIKYNINVESTWRWVVSFSFLLLMPSII